MSRVTQHATAGRRRWWWVALGAGFGSIVLFVLVWFQPQKLVIDERVDETIPVPTQPPTTEAAAPAGSTAPGPAASTEPVELARGDLRSLDHGTSGVARVLELSDGRRIVRLEDLDTSNGPDLFVYLTANPTDGEEGAFDDDYVDLGRLKGNQGNQTYDLPAELDLTLHGTVVIWCDRFDSAFGAADLQPA
jgi:hypothetical protein